MEDTICLRLLGPAQVERDGEAVGGFESRKALALLGYLALQDEPVPCEHLVDLLGTINRKPGGGPASVGC